MNAAATFLVLLSYFTFCQGWTCTAPAQHYAASQIDAGLGMVVMTDTKSNVFFLSGSSMVKLGSVPLKHVSVGPAGIWGVGGDDRIYKFTAGDFFPTCGQKLKQVDAGGEGQVGGVANGDSIHCLTASSALSIKEEDALNWSTVPGGLMYISCGLYGCWGVNSNQNIYFTKIAPSSCSIHGWILIDGASVNVEVGTDGKAFVVNQNGDVFERLGITDKVPQGTGWNHINVGVPLKQASYDLGRLWLVTAQGFIMECTD